MKKQGVVASEMRKTKDSAVMNMYVHMLCAPYYAFRYLLLVLPISWSSNIQTSN